ncbi:hypothetical protein AAOE16_07660 [Ekhidna sp. MALMAid0563]|uniref:hypothetical protein n=1 Tax=Ekhidna sp. MALMAid0563 TaxID=3143937 RepID=UPI0032E05492
MKKLFALSIIGLSVLTSCQNDDEKNVDLNAEEASQAINASADQLSNDVVSLVESEGVSAMTNFAELLEGSEVIGGRVSQKAWTKEQLDLIIQYFVNGPSTRTNNDHPTTFDDLKGLYEWNPAIQEFDKEASEYFIVKFPTEGSETNNAELKISDLQFVTITKTDDGFVDEYEVPSVIVGYLKVDDVTYIELNFNVNWSSEGMPEEADVSLFVKPFTFTIKFDDTFATSASLLSSIYIDEELIIGIDLDVQFEDNTKEEPVYFEGSISYRTLKIVGNVDIREIEEEGNPNDYINLALYSNDSKLGDIVFMLEEVDGGFEDYVAYVEYSDGSKENLEEILEPVLAEIEAIFAEF